MYVSFVISGDPLINVKYITIFFLLFLSFSLDNEKKVICFGFHLVDWIWPIVVDSTTIVVNTQVWNTRNKFGRKVFTEKEELHYDHPPIEKTLLLFVILLLLNTSRIYRKLCYYLFKALAVLWFDYKNSNFEKKGGHNIITETYVLNREKILTQQSTLFWYVKQKQLQETYVK